MRLAQDQPDLFVAPHSSITIEEVIQPPVQYTAALAANASFLAEIDEINAEYEMEVEDQPWRQTDPITYDMPP